MRITVIVPAYNSEKYLRETIESVLAQTVTNWEMVLVNDGSKDSTEQIAREYSERDGRIRLINRTNGGVAAARNTGYQSVHKDSEFICYLDNDDIWEHDALEVLMQALDANPEAVAAHGIPRAIDQNGKLIRSGELEAYSRTRRVVQGDTLVNSPVDNPTTFACFVERNSIITPGVGMIRHSAHQQAGGWDERLSGCDDWDLWTRLCRFGDVVFLNRVVLNYRLHGSNLSGSLDFMARSDRAMRRKLLTWPGETTERRSQVIRAFKIHSRAMTEIRMTWARDCLRNGKLVPALHQMRHAVYHYFRYTLGPIVF